MNIVSLSLCYPSDSSPQAGLFVRERLRAMSQYADVRVVHPVPTPAWKPRAWSEATADEPRTWHVPMPYVPWLTTPINPWLYARAVLPMLESLNRQRQIHMIDAHFSFPDGVAAARVARRLGLPFTVTLRGVLERALSRPLIRGAVLKSLHDASRIVAVSRSLRDLAVRHGVDAGKIDVVPNGVDTKVFTTGDRDAARRTLGLEQNEKILITVGHLCPRKGFHRVLEVLPELLRRDATTRYVIVGGNGAERGFATHLEQMTKRLGIEESVIFTGALKPDRIALWLQAADLFVLPTSNEGWCNAISEAVACELPVVCTDVGGNREIVTPESGSVVPFGHDRALLAAIIETLNRPRSTFSQSLVRTWSDVGREAFAALTQAARTFCDISKPDLRAHRLNVVD